LTVSTQGKRPETDGPGARRIVELGQDAYRDAEKRGAYLWPCGGPARLNKTGASIDLQRSDLRERPHRLPRTVCDDRSEIFDATDL